MSTISASTTSTTAYKVVADTTGTLVLQTGSTPTTAVTFDASQNMGLGVTPQTWQSTSKALQIGVTGAIRGRSDANLVNMMSNFYTDSAGTNKYIVADYATNYQQYQGTHAWYYAASGSAGGTVSFTQAMALDASGNLMIGATSPVSRLHAAGSGTTAISVSNSTPGTSGSPQLTQFNFLGYNNEGRARLEATDVAASAYGGTLRFYTASSVDNTMTQRAVIDSSGNLLVGTTSTGATSGTGVRFWPSGYINATSSASANGTTTLDVYSTGASAFRFYVGMGGTVYATSTTITAISDQRLKENIRDLDDGLDVVMALQPRKFDWKDGKGKGIANDRGFIAQEFEQVLPDMVEEWRDPAPEGEEPYKAVNANLIPTLVKAIQEQQAIIETLTNRITALEAK